LFSGRLFFLPARPQVLGQGEWRHQVSQIFIFCYHKTGTKLFAKIARKLAAAFGVTYQTMVGMVSNIDRRADIVLFAHSLLDLDLGDYDYRGIHVVRDPRDIWVSGYLYHCRTDEAWCVNTDFDLSPPIVWPRVPRSQQHKPEKWKREYLAGLGNRSYQQNLQSLDRRSGMRFELERYTSWTLEAMADWVRHPEHIMELQLESCVADFDGTMTAILSHWGFSGDYLRQALAIAATEDVGRMDDRTVAGMPHVYSRQLSKWATMIDPNDLEQFELRHGALIEHLGYRRSIKRHAADDQ
jgi:hypothetical protein